VENETREVTREELYKLVWSKPLVILAQEFGISDVGLAKICKRLNVPRPYRGYWALVAAGRKMSIPSLPPAKKDIPVKAFISPYVKPQPTIEDRARAALIETESLSANRIIVAETLHGAHPLIRETRKLLERGFVDVYGRLFASWREKPKDGCLDLRVTKKSLYRALRIMDALVKAIEARGGEIETKDRQTLCVMNQAEVRFNLWEKVTRSERELTKEERGESYVRDRWIYTPTGEITFKIEEWNVGKKSWKDKKQKPLEDQLNDIMVGLITASQIIHARDLEREREEERRLEAECQRQEIERQRRLEEERHEELEKMAALWVKSRNLKLFLDECQSSLSASAGSPADDSKARWLRWASAYADSLDPFNSGRLSKMVQTCDEPYKSEP
jgi:predicted nucleic acid-binding protein